MELETRIRSEDIVQALGLPHCSLFENGLTIWPVGNSYVYSMNWFPIESAIKSSFPGYARGSIKIGQNLVQITGSLPNDEQPAENHLHTHISGIVAGVTRGSGMCLYERSGKVLKQIVRIGDVAIIPPNAPHTFEGNPFLEYMVIEFGPKLDYQKHHYDKKR